MERNTGLMETARDRFWDLVSRFLLPQGEVSIPPPVYRWYIIVPSWFFRFTFPNSNKPEKQMKCWILTPSYSMQCLLNTLRNIILRCYTECFLTLWILHCFLHCDLASKAQTRPNGTWVSALGTKSMNLIFLLPRRSHNHSICWVGRGWSGFSSRTPSPAWDTPFELCPNTLWTQTGRRPLSVLQLALAVSGTCRVWLAQRPSRPAQPNILGW